MSDSKIIVALDYPTMASAISLANQLDPDRCKLKVGKELFTCSGPQIVENFTAKGFDIFLDLKYHDIPNTVAKACRVAADLGVWMVNVHTLGGQDMMVAAREAISDKPQRPLLIGVTLLTSMNKETFQQIGLVGTLESTVIKLANLAQKSGLDGVVCSPLETKLLRTRHTEDFQLVTPGIRPTDSESDDQHRTMTPIQAVDAGSNYLVIGRPITNATNPMQALELIENTLR